MNAPTTMPKETIERSADVKESLVLCKTSQGLELRGTPTKLTRYRVVFEVYSPSLVLRTSEVLDDFKIVLRDRTIYSGRAVVRSLVDAGSMVICEAALGERAWLDLEFTSDAYSNGKLRDEFNCFLQEWQRFYRVMPEFKVVVADMHSFLSDLRLWLEQVELNARSQPSGSRDEFERNTLQRLREPVLPALEALFDRFEHVASDIEMGVQSAHGIYAKRQLHPVVLCAPFMYRTFQKPLGYAGDYEMVNMMVRNPFEGGSVFAKILNTYFLNTPPVVGHRNRIDYLYRVLVQEINRVAHRGRTAKVFNLGCGPAIEVQRLLKEERLCERAQFTLLDFNEETLAHVRRTLEDIRSTRRRGTPIHLFKKSVHQVLKESAKAAASTPEQQFDLVYCAGLFDYFSDQVCRRLMELFYDLARPGGLVMVSNVNGRNPSRGWMEVRCGLEFVLSQFAADGRPHSQTGPAGCRPSRRRADWSKHLPRNQET